MPRLSSRSNKGQAPSPFDDWTPHGKCWSVKSKEVVLPRKIGQSRVHITPPAEIRQSGIRRAGKGLFLRRGVPSLSILAEYDGEVIGIHDADKLITQVCPMCQTICSLNLCSLWCILYLRCVRQGKATHIIRIGDSLWCLDSAITSVYPMELYVDGINVTGFAKRYLIATRGS